MPMKTDPVSLTLSEPFTIKAPHAAIITHTPIVENVIMLLTKLLYGGEFALLVLLGAAAAAGAEALLVEGCLAAAGELSSLNL
jgi:hypothetical protein